MNIHLFDGVASEYTTEVSPYRHAQFLAMVHEMKLDGTEHILDIGCGPGVLSLEAAARLPKGRLTGIDLSPRMLDLARDLANKAGYRNVRYELGDAMNLNYADGKFDYVMSSNAFPWVSSRTKFLAEVRRVLKPGGRLALVSLSQIVYREFIEALLHVADKYPQLSGLKTDPYRAMKVRLYDVEGLSEKVASAGFEVNRGFILSTEEPITPAGYIKRVNSVVNENYLDNLDDRIKEDIRNEIFLALARKNGNLKVTESSVFVFARKN